jgi:hypothetical protein
MENSFASLLDEALALAIFDPDPEEGSIPVLHEPGEGRLLAVTGENASGKSLFGRIINGLCSRRKIECMRLGMERRSEGGFARAMMYGDESWESTGVISVKNIMGAFKTCKGRENEHFLFLDEPDIGLSEAYQGGLGKFIAQFAADMPSLTLGFVIVTHSRHLLRPLLPLKPHHVRCGDKRTLQSVAEDTPTPKTADELIALPEAGLRLFREITARKKRS